MNPRREGGFAKRQCARFGCSAPAVATFTFDSGARTVWLETTSMNVPGIRAYERLGYRLCGCDTTLYDTLVYADEAALYFSKPL